MRQLIQRYIVKHFVRLALVVTIGCLGFTAGARAQQVLSPIIAPVVPASQTMVGHPAPGYLGVVCANVEQNEVSPLKLKSATGVEVIEVDRDAPAGKAGLRPHDVLLKMNGHALTGVEQLRQMLAGTPAGTAVTLLVSRAGHQRTVSLRLANRTALERNAWSPVLPNPDNKYEMEGGSGHGFANSFLGVFGLGSPSVGVDLDALGSQLADYFGVSDGQGLLVKHVAENSPASRAGLRAGDVIVSVNGHKMATLSDWMKMVHANRGKAMRINFFRNRKQQTTTMLTGKNHSEWYAPRMAPLFHVVSTAG